MNPLQSIVCLKVVPRPEEVRVNPQTLTLDRAHARSVINPADMHALEMALALRDRHGGAVRLLAMGPPFFTDYLQLAMAIGADQAYLLSDRAFGGADTLATSYALALGIRKIGAADLIFCGEESSDGATAQVPPGIAEWLDLPQVTYAAAVSLVGEPPLLRAQREIRGGHEVLRTSLPAVISVRLRANEPRFLDPARLEWARATPVTVWNAAEIGADPTMLGTAGSPTTVAGIREAPKRERRRERLAGSPEQQAQALAARIRAYIAQPARPAVASPSPNGH